VQGRVGSGQKPAVHGARIKTESYESLLQISDMIPFGPDAERSD